jgi:cyclophilin family peptidyl-prolyl cis-trans isomerase
MNRPLRRPLLVLTLLLPVVIAMLTSAIASAQPPDPGRLSRERVVFHTIGGDLVFSLYPDAAPETVKQFLALVRAGVYDTTNFVRIDPGFMAQTSSAADRLDPLTEKQSALLRKLPAELSPLKHEKGTLSMAHAEGEPDTAETSFFILLTPAPHLDGKFTVFGRLESGEDVLDEMVKVARGDANRPVARLDIRSAVVLPSDKALGRIKLEPAHAVPFEEPPVSGDTSKGTEGPATEQPSKEPPSAALPVVVPAKRGPRAISVVVACAWTVLMALGVSTFLLRGRIRARYFTADR